MCSLASPLFRGMRTHAPAAQERIRSSWNDQCPFQTEVNVLLDHREAQQDMPSLKLLDENKHVFVGKYQHIAVFETPERADTWFVQIDPHLKVNNRMTFVLAHQDKRGP